MKHANKYPLANLIAIVIAAALLLFLFLFPRQFLKEMTDEIAAHAQASLDATLSGDWDEATAHIYAANARFDRGSETAKLFLNHEDVDEMESLINSATRLAQVRDDAELVIQLERILGTAAYMGGIETFDIVDLF